MVSALVHHLLSTPAVLVYALVGLLVFAEDAIFVGFLLPGETAAMLGGVDASRHHVSLPLVLAIVVAAAIVGDSVGYEVGRRFGGRLLRGRLLGRHATRIAEAQQLVARRGGWAVLVGRSVAFLRAVTPALAGTAGMPYRRFLAFNATGGLLWGVGAVMIGFVAGDSYQKVAATAGNALAVVIATVVVTALLTWHFRRRLRASRRDAAPGPTGPDGVARSAEPATPAAQEPAQSR